MSRFPTQTGHWNTGRVTELHNSAFLASRNAHHAKSRLAYLRRVSEPGNDGFAVAVNAWLARYDRDEAEREAAAEEGRSAAFTWLAHEAEIEELQAYRAELAFRTEKKGET